MSNSQSTIAKCLIHDYRHAYFCVFAEALSNCTSSLVGNEVNTIDEPCYTCQCKVRLPCNLHLAVVGKGCIGGGASRRRERGHISQWYPHVLSHSLSPSFSLIVFSSAQPNPWCIGAMETCPKGKGTKVPLSQGSPYNQKHSTQHSLWHVCIISKGLS